MTFGNSWKDRQDAERDRADRLQQAAERFADSEYADDWWQYRDGLARLHRYLADEKGYDQYELSKMLDEPWHWSKDYYDSLCAEWRALYKDGNH